MQMFRTEGVVIQTLPFQDHDLILTVFTKDLGLAKFLLKAGNRSGTKQIRASTLMQAEFVYQQSKSDLLKCLEISPLNHNLKIRQKLTSLEAAFDMLKALRLSQFSGQPATEIYQLLVFFLKRLDQFSNPQIAAASFFLKILRHEGLLDIKSESATLNQVYELSDEENKVCTILTFARSLQELQNLSLSSSLYTKIHFFFERAFR